jgi:hypothetical protein
MAYHYSDPGKEDNPYALPDIEVFEVVDATPYDECPACQSEETERGVWKPNHDDHCRKHTGWYWWMCSPGYMPNGEADGPFSSEEAALGAARADAE